MSFFGGLFFMRYLFFQGSGKTYTMGGGNMNSFTEEEYGIIPRALKDMFDYMQVS